MDFDLQAWMQAFIRVVREAFAERVRFIGLQGSHARGEAHAESDLDVVVILDSLNAADVARYREAIAPLPHRARMCGFLSGADVLRCWDRADLFQFYHDTEPYFGALEPLLPPIAEADVRRAVHAGACALYHACCHNLTHARSLPTLHALQKNLRFVLQAKHFAQTGEYLRGKAALMEQLSPSESALLIPAKEDALESVSGALLQFLGETIQHYSADGGTCANESCENTAPTMVEHYASK